MLSVSSLPACRRAILVICVWLGWLSAGAGTPWFARVWQVDQGLPVNSVTGVAQTRDGFLWLGTQAGLARFDGLYFQRVPMPFGRTHRLIRGMLLDRDENLWLAEETGVVACFPTGGGTVHEWTNGFPRSMPADLAQSGDKAIWIAYADGSVCRVDGRNVRQFTEQDGLPSTGTCSLAVDARGQLWFAKAGQVGSFDGARFVPQLNLNERNVVIQAARDDGLWICAGERLLKYVAAKAVELAVLPTGGGIVLPTALFEDESGAVWVGTLSHGLFRHDDEETVRVETSHGRIKAIAGDREGNIWVGTDGGGLNRLRQQVVELKGKEAGLPFDTVRSASADARGVIWVVTQNGTVATLTGGRWRVLTAEDGWQGGSATCVSVGRDGVVCIGTLARGIQRWQNGSFTNAWRRADGLAGSNIRALLHDRRGDLWIAFGVGTTLQRHREGRFQNFDLPVDSRAVRTIAEDAAGRIWMANLDAQLLRVEEGRIVDETARTPEPHRPIRCLVGSPDGSLWIGYSSLGIGRLKKGQFSLVSTEEGLPDNGICSLTPDDRGWLWVGSDQGIFRVSIAELGSAADGVIPSVRAIRHGKDDGLPSLQGYYGYAPGAVRAADGRVLIPTHSGLAIVHPERVANNLVPPPVILERMLVDNETMPLAPTAATAQLPPKHHRIELAFTAPSFIEPERVRFRFKLEGWDSEWVDAGSQRSAIYSRLPAGKYQFRVTAANNAGVWNEAGALLPFEVRPFFWQTWWFRLLLGLLFLGITAAVFASARYVSHRRLQLKVRQLEQENALQRERARIAQDIHDDIGAHMTRISLLTDLTERNLHQPAQAARHVTQIARISRSAIKALDEIVWAANPRNDTVADLLDYAGQYAVDFLQIARVRCRVDFPNDIPHHVLSGEVRHGLFLAVKEALHNVVKHAQATEVWLRATMDGRRLELAIEDNGRGFAAVPDDALADGLRNMRQRLADIGGTCSIDSRPGEGARIRFELPLAKHE